MTISNKDIFNIMFTIKLVNKGQFPLTTLFYSTRVSIVYDQ